MKNEADDFLITVDKNGSFQPSEFWHHVIHQIFNPMMRIRYRIQYTLLSHSWEMYTHRFICTIKLKYTKTDYMSIRVSVGLHIKYNQSSEYSSLSLTHTLLRWHVRTMWLEMAVKFAEVWKSTKAHDCRTMEERDYSLSKAEGFFLEAAGKFTQWTEAEKQDSLLLV